jgi:uncharacterized protein (TIGR03546 family)
MALILKQVFAFLKMLNSETGHNSLAAGIAAGFILGMSPMLSLQGILVLLCIFVFRIQMGAAFLAAFFFAFIAWTLDPAFHALGSAILEADGLQGLFTAMYNMPFVPLTRFNNSIVMGAGVLAVILSPVIYFASLFLIMKYRSTVLAWIKQTKIWKAFQATALYNWYYSYEKLYGH